METNPTQLRLASITYGSGLEEHHLYDYDHQSGEILELLTSLPDSATFRITRIDFNLIGAAARKASDKLDETRETLERMEERLSNTRESFLEALEEIGSLKESIKSYEDGIRNQCLEMNLALSLLMVQREVLERDHNSDPGMAFDSSDKITLIQGQ